MGFVLWHYLEFFDLLNDCQYMIFFSSKIASLIATAFFGAVSVFFWALLSGKVQQPNDFNSQSRAEQDFWRTFDSLKQWHNSKELSNMCPRVIALFVERRILAYSSASTHADEWIHRLYLDRYIRRYDWPCRCTRRHVHLRLYADPRGKKGKKYMCYLRKKKKTPETPLTSPKSMSYYRHLDCRKL